LLPFVVTAMPYPVSAIHRDLGYTSWEQKESLYEGRSHVHEQPNEFALGKGDGA